MSARLGSPDRPSTPHRRVGLLAAGLLLLASCGHGGTPVRAEPGQIGLGVASASPSEPAASATASAAACSPSAGWDCGQQARFTRAASYLRGRPGQLSIVVRDRTTGAVWRAGATATATWTASTIKVAIAARLLEQQRAGRIRLTDADRQTMTTMLVVSSNDAATALWAAYDGPAMLPAFRSAYGMTGLSVVPGYEVFWRNLRCTAEDLAHLMTYVLERMHPQDRAYLVSTLRGVAANQHWGVWAAGAAMSPGNKDGWAIKPDGGVDHWVTHTVGFVGPGERYVVAVMHSLPAGRSMADGAHAVSDLVALVFGAPTPAPISLP